MNRKELLNSMANYNETTIRKITINLSKKIGIPSTTQLFAVDWNLNADCIAAGGACGTLKIMKFENVEGNRGNSNLSVNQALDGHNGDSVVCVSWNEPNQKLTTSDSTGLIVVWGIHNDTWFEEMINNRNKSTVVGMGWNPDGSRIAIAYADGQVIVGTLEGNRIWNKDLPHGLVACEWAPDGNCILFGTKEGDVHMYDSNGNPHIKIHMICLESGVDMASILSKEKPPEIVCIKYWYPALKAVESANKANQGGPPVAKSEEVQKKDTSQIQDRLAKMVVYENPLPTENNTFPPDRPRLMIAFAHGVIQLMRSENDQNPIVVRIANFTISCARFSPNGAFIAVTGYTTEPGEVPCTIYILTAYGRIISFRRLRDLKTITGVAWDPTGLKLAVTTDTFLYFADIRPHFKWVYVNTTIVYVFQKEELNHYAVVFYNTKTEEVQSKTVLRFEEVASYQDYCIIINKQEDQNGTYFIQLCNSIGTALDFKSCDVPPLYVGLNGMAAVVANENHYYIWHFVLPKYNSVQAGIHIPGKDAVYSLDDQLMSFAHGSKRALGHNKERIEAIAVADTYFLMGCVYGGIYKVSLHDGKLMQHYDNTTPIETMKFNCNFTRVAIIHNFQETPFNISINFINDEKLTLIKSIENQEIWGCVWDAEHEDMIAVNEKGKLTVFHDDKIVDSAPVFGSICALDGLNVRTVMIDNLLLHAENPAKKNVVLDIEMKALKDVKNLLERGKIEEACALIEKEPHPRLWKHLAETCLIKLDWSMVEHAYVKLGDYAGVNFVKRVRPIGNYEIQAAEVFGHLGKYDKAEALFLNNDRKDLAIEMYSAVNMWANVLKLNKGEDRPLQLLALKNIADQHYEHMEWQPAYQRYAECGDLAKQIDCCIRGNDFGRLEELTRSLPNDSEFMEKIGDAFTSRGLCTQAVECFLRKGLIDRALQSCIELNYWEKANNLAKTHDLKGVDLMLAKFAPQIKSILANSTRSWQALQLFRRAGRFLEAAKIAFDIASDERSKKAAYKRLKKIYVLGGLCVEDFHKLKEQGDTKPNAKKVLENAINEEMDVTIEESRTLEIAWKGAEAYHFILLAYKHLENKHPDDALRTAIVLTDYEAFIDAREIYSLLAMTALNVSQYAVASKAMMRLEGMRELSEREREELQDMSFALFDEHPPLVPKQAPVICPSCSAETLPYENFCTKCSSKFPVCVASGRIMLENKFWMCGTCKHRALQHEIMNYKNCPLCHSLSSFQS